MQTAPATYLPNEMLTIIFENFVLAAHPEVARREFIWERGRIDRAFHNAITVSHVCSTWRSVSIGTPSLWTSISLYVEEWSFKSYPRDRISLCMERSEPLNLNVSLGLQWDHSSPLNDELEDGLARLLSTTERWGSLTLSYFSSRQEHLDLFLERQNRFPALSRLWFNTGPKRLFPPTAFLQALKLAHVQVEGYPKGGLQLCWGALRSFKARSLHHSLLALRRSPKLESCSFSSRQSIFPSGSEICEHSSLLHFSFPVPFSTTHWLAGKIRFPSLLSLEQGSYCKIPSNGHWVDNSVLGFTGYLKDFLIPMFNHSPHLQRLTLKIQDVDDLCVSGQDLLRDMFLYCLPNLRELHLFLASPTNWGEYVAGDIPASHWGSCARALQSLQIHTPRDSPSIPLPGLVNLEVDLTGNGEPFGTEALVSQLLVTVSSRTATEARLEKFLLRFYEKYRGNVEKYLTSFYNLQRQGLFQTCIIDASVVDTR